MDGPPENDVTGEVRISPKLSRRKKSRPVKFSQDYVLTDFSDEFANSGTEASSVTCSSPGNGMDSFEGSPLAMEATPGGLCHQDEISQASSAEMIHRNIPSIRDSSCLRVDSPKRIKLEENDSPVPKEQNVGQQETETTFSSLLHTFASQVTRTVEPTEHRSPYKEQQPDTIWQTQGGNPSAITGTDQTSRRTTPLQRKQASTSTTSPHEMSFSGMLKNFVSCVNDSPQKEASVDTPALMALLQKGGKPNKSIPITVGSECQSESNPLTDGTQSPYAKDSASFAGLLHTFASVVDKEGQGSSRETVHKNFLTVDSSGGRQQKATKSLLDVLHDTISRRVMESASSPPQDPSTQLGHSRDRFGSPAINSAEIPGSSTYVVDHIGVRSAMQFSSQEACVSHSMTSEPFYDLHPSGQQWSHIRNVLPPLDAEEDDTTVPEQKYQQLHVGGHSYEYDDAGERLEESENGFSLSNVRQPIIKQEPVDEDIEIGQSFTGQENQVIVKVEPGEYPSSSTCDPASQDVTSTLRERLLSRIESRQSPQMKSSVHSSSVASPMSADFVRHDFGDSPQEGSNVPPSDLLAADGQGMQEQPGLVSHLLSSGDSFQWRNKCSGSFADLLHNITSTMLEKDVPAERAQGNEPEYLTIKQEPKTSDDEQPTHSAQGRQSSKKRSRPVNTVKNLLKAKRASSSPEKTVPRCITRLLSAPGYSDISREGQEAEMREVRAQKLKVLSYAEAPSTSTSPSTSSEDIDQRNVNIQPRTKGKQLHSLSPRSRHAALIKQRLKKGTKFGLRLKQGWPKRREDIHHARGDTKSLQSSHQQYDKSVLSTSQAQPVESDTSFTDLLQKLAQKCQAGNVEAFGQQSPTNLRSSLSPRSSMSPVASTSPHQSDLYIAGRHQEQLPRGKASVQSGRTSDRASAANLRTLLTHHGSLAQHPTDADPTSGSPSTSVQLGDVSFSNLMQDMASTIKQKGNTSHTPFEDLRSLDPPSAWLKSVSGNWLRFLSVSPDENPKVTISVAVNLWNSIHEVKIHCHHIEVPVNHWIFRRFGKRIHTKAALLGVLQAISNGCSVCEGTTRSDLIQMYRNKLASTSRWQAAAVLEDSFGSATIRSKQCELLVSGLRRSREKRCSKCSMYVDRKLKAVMYHMRKKLGLS